MFLQHWCSWAGMPEVIFVDQGGEFRGAFTSFLERWGISAQVGPAEAPWHQALMERHGAVLGDIARMTIEEVAAVGVDEMRLVCFYAALCKNRRVDRSGYSARERVFGQADRLPGSALGSFLQQEDIPGDFMARYDAAHRRSIEIRSAASAALVRLDHADRYRRAIAHPPRTECLDLVQGTQVFYWRAANTRRTLRGRRFRDFDRWRGPGVIIGDERRPDGGRRAYWVSHAGSLLLAPPEHVRLATRMEQLMPGAVSHLLRSAA